MFGGYKKIIFLMQSPFLFLNFNISVRKPMKKKSCGFQYITKMSLNRTIL